MESSLRHYSYHQLQRDIVELVEKGELGIVSLPIVLQHADKRTLARIGYLLMERGEMRPVARILQHLKAVYHDPCGLHRCEQIVWCLDGILSICRTFIGEEKTFATMEARREDVCALWLGARTMGMPLFYGGEYLAQRLDVVDWASNLSIITPDWIAETDGNIYYPTKLRMREAIRIAYCISFGKNDDFVTLYRNDPRRVVPPYTFRYPDDIIRCFDFINIIYVRSEWLFRFDREGYRKAIVAACIVLEPHDWYERIMSTIFSDEQRPVFLAESLSYAKKNGYTEWLRRAKRLVQDRIKV